MTILPRMLTRPSSRRMASTAALSAPLLLPCPLSRAAAIAAASVTRATSRTKTLSKPPLVIAIAPVSSVCPAAVLPLHGRAGEGCPLQLFYADHLWLRAQPPVRLDGLEGGAHGRLGGLMRNDNHRRRLAGLRLCTDAGQRLLRATLHDTFERDAAIAHLLGDERHDAGPVLDQQADVIGALELAKFRPPVGLEPRRRHAKRGHYHAVGDVDDVARDRRSRRLCPGTGPDQQQRADEIAVDGHAVGD